MAIEAADILYNNKKKKNTTLKLFCLWKITILLCSRFSQR
jgi:hypothetical protein